MKSGSARYGATSSECVSRFFGRAAANGGESDVDRRFGRHAHQLEHVLATIQGFGEANLYIKGVSISIADKRFTIRMSKAPAADTKVGWFIVNRLR